ncbi:hypothetical protein FIBSPDRAFT_882725 [Athelia psychrophila]|uniref:BTB domain-containing protein n=1 Tax=Athelia psychrophila TaxID=1759441 RepID=A0A166V6W4_9AGAM|nr:hypothetical protein FIBSPDRAFT_882725 [Fibularhizoctonia sp. CBS 109695]
MRLDAHPTYSFDDGSTILNVKPTSFPVHRIMLCTHSILFATTFSMPQISPWDERDDCLVDMPDSPKYFVCLLKAFYKPLDVDAACGILRQNTKYDMPVIRKRLIEQLQCYFPPTWLNLKNAPQLTYVVFGSLRRLSKENFKACVQGREAFNDAMASRGPLSLSVSNRCTNMVGNKASWRHSSGRREAQTTRAHAIYRNTFYSVVSGL